MEKAEKQNEPPCLAVERLESIPQFNECFGQGQTSRHGIGCNHNKSVPFSKMSNKQQHGKRTEITRQEAEGKRIVLLMKYNIQNGFLNCQGSALSVIAVKKRKIELEPLKTQFLSVRIH